jgi:hypothetical protein
VKFSFLPPVHTLVSGDNVVGVDKGGTAVAFITTLAAKGTVFFSNRENVEIALGVNDDWPNKFMDAHWTLNDKANEWDLDVSTTYNFRFLNNGDAPMDVKVRVYLKTDATTPPASMISGPDALAMSICVLGVFVVFSVLAFVTMRHMPPSEQGTLVVEEEEEL